MGFSLKRKINKKRKKLIKKLITEDFYLQLKGFCPVCDNHVIFNTNETHLRETLDCPICKSLSRERAFMLVLEKYYPQWRDLHIHESSPCPRGVSRIMKEQGKYYTGSQYYPDHKFGTMVNGFRNEDLENMTFPDNSFDLVITQDVFEHIYNPEKAFKEIARTLKKGGAHIFSIPVINKHKKTEIWATKGDNGKPVFLKEPEYHGNPVDADGSPVTMHWGYDIIDFIKDITGMETSVETYTTNLEYGIFSIDLDAFVSVKK